MATIRYYIKDRKGRRVGGEVTSRLFALDAALQQATDSGEPMEVWEHFKLSADMETDRPLGIIVPPGKAN